MSHFINSPSLHLQQPETFCNSSSVDVSAASETYIECQESVKNQVIGCSQFYQDSNTSHWQHQHPVGVLLPPPQQQLYEQQLQQSNEDIFYQQQHNQFAQQFQQSFLYPTIETPQINLSPKIESQHQNNEQVHPSKSVTSIASIKSNSFTCNKASSGSDSFSSQHQQIRSVSPEKVIQRFKANKKERRRTQLLNEAFSKLRRHIPDVPIDTKLSKIKTLRLAISYISHLANALNDDVDKQQANNHNLNVVSRRLVCFPVKKIKLGASSSSKSIVATSAIGSLTYIELAQPYSTKPSGSLANIVSSDDRNSQKKKNRDRKLRTGWPELMWRSANLSKTND